MLTLLEYCLFSMFILFISNPKAWLHQVKTLIFSSILSVSIALLTNTNYHIQISNWNSAFLSVHIHIFAHMKICTWACQMKYAESKLCKIQWFELNSSFLSEDFNQYSEATLNVFMSNWWIFSNIHPFMDALIHSYLYGSHSTQSVPRWAIKCLSLRRNSFMLMAWNIDFMAVIEC